MVSFGNLPQKLTNILGDIMRGVKSTWPKGIKVQIAKELGVKKQYLYRVFLNPVRPDIAKRIANTEIIKNTIELTAQDIVFPEHSTNPYASEFTPW